MGGGSRKPGTSRQQARHAAMAVIVKFLALNIKNEAKSYHSKNVTEFFINGHTHQEFCRLKNAACL
jgi:hypothetical protein